MPGLLAACFFIAVMLLSASWRPAQDARPAVTTAAINKGLRVVTIELLNGMRTPKDSETRQMWPDLLR